MKNGIKGREGEKKKEKEIITMEFKFEYQLMKLTEQNREMERTVIKKKKGEKKRERKK